MPVSHCSNDDSSLIWADQHVFKHEDEFWGVRLEVDTRMCIGGDTKVMRVVTDWTPKPPGSDRAPRTST
jgi:hypothetical protein